MFRHTDYLKMYGVVLIPLFVILAAWNWQSGLLGPSSLRQCFLDKMKGLPQDMEEIAAAECQKQFPPAPVPVVSSEPLPQILTDVQYQYCDFQYGSNYKICVNGVPNGYKIVRVEAVFYHNNGNECHDMYTEDFNKSDHWIGTKAWFKDEYTFDMKADAHICGIFAFYGLRT